MRIAFCGFDFFASCLESSLRCGHSLIGAFSYAVDGYYNSNEQISRLCDQNNVNLVVERISDRDIMQLADRGCKLLLVAGYPHLIPTQKLRDLGINAVNVHPTLLPVGRGPWPLPHIILKALKYSGVTIHKLAATFDSGDIVMQRSFSVSENESLESLSCKSQMLAANLVGEMFDNFEGYWLNARPQAVGEYWPMPKEHDRTLNWSLPVAQIERTVRAFGKFESYGNFDGSDWLIQAATVWPEIHTVPVGSVVHRTNREVVVAATDGFVCITDFKKEP